MNELARIETVMILQSVDLLSSCSAEQILGLSAIARQDLLPAGTILYREGDPAEALYFVVRGTVREEPKEGPAWTIGPSGTVGVNEILSGRLRTRTAIVEEETLALSIEAEDFFDLLSNNIEIVKALFRRFLEAGSHRKRSNS